MLSQGTISVLFGCHSLPHALAVIAAWKQLYGRWPAPWEIICILLHDVGHVGKDYLDDPKQKAEHWRLGALLAGLLYGKRGYQLCAGHCRQSGEPESRLYRADKLSWLLAPQWFLWSNVLVEPKLRDRFHGRREGVREHARWFREQVRQSVTSEAWTETHELYLRRVRGEDAADPEQERRVRSPAGGEQQRKDVND